MTEEHGSGSRGHRCRPWLRTPPPQSARSAAASPTYPSTRAMRRKGHLPPGVWTATAMRSSMPSSSSAEKCRTSGFNPACDSAALSLNASDVVVVWAHKDIGVSVVDAHGGRKTAFVWQNGTMQELQSLLVPAPGENADIEEAEN